MRIEFPGETGALKALWKTAFGDEDAFIDAFFATAYSPDRCRCAMAEDRLGAMLFWLDGELDGEKAAYLYAVATEPAFRGRGLCRALMEDTHDLLAARGYAAALLYPADGGLRRMYGKMGYRDFGEAREFACRAAGTEPVRTIGAEEYGCLRRQYLPENSLVQEGENLRFLEKTAGLYAGQGFLLAASMEGQTLRAAEFLGREDAAPGILTALGCQTGTFRTGAEAMIRPLKEKAPDGGYVGLVFD